MVGRRVAVCACTKRSISAVVIPGTSRAPTYFAAKAHAILDHVASVLADSKRWQR